MKKIIVPVLLLCLLLTACGQQNGSQPTSNKVTTLPRDPWIVDYGLLSFFDIDSYNQFVQMADLPDDFVYYESLMHFGEFRGLVILSPAIDEYRAVDYSKYLYSFEDEAGNRLCLEVGYEPQDVPVVDSKYWGDMQGGGAYIGTNNAYVERNGIKYLYLWNKLYAICWESNGLHFCLDRGTKVDVFYPDDGPLTIIHELLHTDTNKAALEKINAALETPAVK